MFDTAEFLRRYAPFDALPDDELGHVASLTDTEFYLRGQTVLDPGDGPADRVRVVRTGAVELVCEGTVLDLLLEGEIFGQASMLSGLPAGFTARAVQDTVVYSLPTAAVQALLVRPGALRFLVRSAIEDPVSGAGNRPPLMDPLRRPVRSLLRAPLTRCGPGELVRDVARIMTERRAGSVIVEDAGGLLGIITDTDLRSRVVAAGLSGDVAVAQVMTTPVWTVTAERAGGDALLEMVEHGVRHLPVLGPDGRVLGVLEDHDLVAAETRTPFVLRRRIERAAALDELATAAEQLGPTVLALHRAGADSGQISALWSAVVDALVRRLIELALAERPDLPPFTWLALGSLARREAVPSSDVDSALSWPSDSSDAPGLRALAAQVDDGLAACGLRADANQLSSADPLFSRPLAQWHDVGRTLLADPAQDKALLLTSVLVDHRAVWGGEVRHDIAAAFEPSRQPDGAARELLLHMMGRYALVQRPPTGFLRDFVVESGGAQRGRLDLKRGGILPIVNLARWAGLRAGVLNASTAERLRAAGAAGTLTSGDAEVLLEVYSVITEVRVSHQVAQWEAGLAADDFIRPAELSSITRAQLKETFRALAAVQRTVQAELMLGG